MRSMTGSSGAFVTTDYTKTGWQHRAARPTARSSMAGLYCIFRFVSNHPPVAHTRTEQALDTRPTSNPNAALEAKRR